MKLKLILLPLAALAFSGITTAGTPVADSPSVGTGTVMRPDTVRRYAAEAGFATTTVLPIEHEVFRFYRLDP